MSRKTKNTPEPQAWKNRKRQKLAKKETHQPKYKGEKRGYTKERVIKVLKQR